MERVTSKDGTTITFDRLGDGPPVVLISGGSVDRLSNAGVAAILASDFAVYNYDRRGRGESGDTQPYAVDREIEDIDAVIEAAGGPVGLYGTSSGAALGLAAAAAGSAVSRLALWEVPYIIGDSRPRPPANTPSIYRDLVAQGRRSDAAEYFAAKVVGLPAEFVEFMKTQPFWAATEALAHTLSYDAEIMGDYNIPEDLVRSVTTKTIVLDGGASPDWMHQTALRIAELLPNASHRTLEGQQHNVADDAIAPVLAEFFAS
jgi:pimeloyl-ACP methyl ester carboxylesterase